MKICSWMRDQESSESDHSRLVRNSGSTDLRLAQPNPEVRCTRLDQRSDAVLLGGLSPERVEHRPSTPRNLEVGNPLELYEQLEESTASCRRQPKKTPSLLSRFFSVNAGVSVGSEGEIALKLRRPGDGNPWQLAWADHCVESITESIKECVSSGQVVCIQE